MKQNKHKTLHNFRQIRPTRGGERSCMSCRRWIVRGSRAWCTVQRARVDGLAWHLCDAWSDQPAPPPIQLSLWPGGE